MYVDTLTILNNALPWNIAVLHIKEIADFQFAPEFSALIIMRDLIFYKEWD